MKKIIIGTILALCFLASYGVYDFYRFMENQMKYYYNEFSYYDNWSDDESIEIVSCILFNDYIEFRGLPYSWKENCEFETVQSFICSKWIESLRLKVMSAQVRELKIQVETIGSGNTDSHEVKNLKNELDKLNYELDRAEQKCSN